MELPDRTALEARFGARLQKLSNRHMRELLELLGSPPNFDNVTPAFWQRVKKETEEEAAALLLLLFMAAATSHVRAAGADNNELAQVEPVLMAQAERHAQDRAAEVGLRAAVGASIRFDRLRERLEAPAVATGAVGDQIPPPTKREIVDAETPIFSPGQTIVTARDETTRARHVGSEAGVKVTAGTREDDIWLNRPALSASGPCPECAPLDGAPRSVWSRLYPAGPPSPHPGCVCVIQYHFEVPGSHDDDEPE